jgi:DNA polymerase elongation subunit (family B)
VSKTNKPKILLLDIETGPGKAYFWNLYDDNIPLDRLIEPGRMLCFAMRWYGDKKTAFYSEWTHTRQEMLTALRDAFAQADAIVTYNGDKFDFRKIRGEFVHNKIRPAAPAASIDLYRTVRGMGFASGKLDYIAKFLEIGQKTKHAGFKLWIGVLEGDKKARKKMQTYNIQDVNLLAKAYKRLAPYITNHPRLRAGSGCTVCGSKHQQSRGMRHTRTMSYQRLECQTCGHWDKGKGSKTV